MRILYGGAFNPPTIAHYQIAKYIVEKYPNCHLTLLPTNNYYFKKELISFTHRKNMLKLLCKEIGSTNITISDYESKLEKYYGTYYILKDFNHPYFVIGADSLAKIHKWIKFPDIVIENKFIVIPRDNISIKKVICEHEVLNKYYINFIIAEDFGKLNISSTMFRNQNNNEYVLDSIAKYIKENKLYEVN